jgi:hypothetical protein
MNKMPENRESHLKDESAKLIDKPKLFCDRVDVKELNKIEIKRVQIALKGSFKTKSEFVKDRSYLN